MNKNEHCERASRSTVIICVVFFIFLTFIPFVLVIAGMSDVAQFIMFPMICLALIISYCRNSIDKSTDRRLSQTTTPYSNVMTHLTSRLADSILNALDSEAPQDYKKAIEKIDEMRNILETRLNEKVCSRSHNH